VQGLGRHQFDFGLARKAVSKGKQPHASSPTRYRSKIAANLNGNARRHIRSYFYHQDRSGHSPLKRSGMEDWALYNNLGNVVQSVGSHWFTEVSYAYTTFNLDIDKGLMLTDA